MLIPLESYFATGFSVYGVCKCSQEGEPLISVVFFLHCQTWGGWGRVLRTPPLPFPCEKESATSASDSLTQV